MDHRSEYLVQLLEKIGGPLMEAITDVSARQQGNMPESPAGDEAQKMAELLAKSVQVSINIGRNMDLATHADQGESVRVALAALAGSIVAEQYRYSGKVPDDNGLGRIAAALQAVMTFSENFIPSPESTQRLKQIAATGTPVDPHQADIQYLQAFIPVVNAIGDFSFGLPEQKLVQEVADRLTKRAMTLRESIFANLVSADDQKYAELALLRTLAALYSECHRTETRKLAQQGAGQPGGVSIAPVWSAFELRVAMMETLGSELAKRQGASSTGAKSPIPVAPAATAPVPPPPLPQEPPKPLPSAPPTAPPAAANPLSMFAKPKEQPPAEPPQSSPPAQSPPASSGQGGGPMSFFKSGDKSASQ